MRSLRLTALALMFGTGFAALASGQDAAPRALPQNPLPGSAAPQAAAAAPDAAKDLQSSLDETGDYLSRGKAVLYLIGIANKCDRRVKCEIYASVTGARGSSLGHTVMIFGATSIGAAAKRTYAMRVKAAGGTA